MRNQAGRGRDAQEGLRALAARIGPYLHRSTVRRSVLEQSLASLNGGEGLREAAEAALADARITIIEDVTERSARLTPQAINLEAQTDADPVDVARQRIARDRSLPQRRRQKVLLTPEEVIGLTLIARPGGEPLEPGGFGRLVGERREAAEALFFHNMRLAYSVSYAYIGQGLEPEDLAQHAMRGLIRAIELFNPTMGTKFSTYATPWLRQTVSRGVADEARAIRLPVHMWELVRKVTTTREELEVDGRKPSLSAVADRCGINVDKVIECLRLAPTVISTDTPLGSDQFTLGDLIDAEEWKPEHIEVQGMYPEDVEGMLQYLNEKEADVLRRRFGLDPFDEPHTLDEIGKVYGVTRERIRQIEGKAANNIRANLAAQGYRVPTIQPRKRAASAE